MTNQSSDDPDDRGIVDAVMSQLEEIAEWNAAPHTLLARTMIKAGQLELDWSELNTKCKRLKAALPPSQHAAFDHCFQDVTAAFGTVIIHATETYDNELDRTQGWGKFWRHLDSSIRGMLHYIDQLPDSPRTDHGNDPGAAAQ